MAASTKRTRSSQWDQFINFCEDLGRRAVPASSQTIVLFIAFLEKRGFQYSSIVNYVNSLASLHHHRDFDGPDLKHFSIVQALAGVKRRREDRPAKREPISPKHLMAIKRGLHLIEPSVRETYWAACLTAFFTLLRRSNLFYAANNQHFLRRGSVLFQRQNTVLRVRHLKTNQFSNAWLNFPLPVMGDHPLCPSHAIKIMLASVNQSPAEPMFAYRDRSGRVKPLSAEHFVQCTRKIMEDAGFQVSHISCHSFRRGAATFASVCGIIPEAIKAQGNRSSDCYLEYLETEKQLRGRFVADVSDAIAKLSL